METFDALHAFRSFRDSFYESLERRADALFELTDALLTAEAVPSPVHLSLQAYGAVRVRAWSELHPKVSAHEGRGSRGPLPIVVGTLVLVEVERLPRGERRREPRVLWLWWSGPEGTEPDLGLLWRAYARRFDLEEMFADFKGHGFDLESTH